MGGDLLHTMDVVGLSRVRTEFHSLLIIPLRAPHPVEHETASFLAIATLAIRLSASHRQVGIPASPVGVAPYGSLRCLHQQEAQQRVALAW